MLDARVRLLEGAKPLRHGARVRIHHGARSTNARIRLLDGEEVRPGGSVLARVRLEEPLVVLSGDRFVLRALAPPVTVGGGTVLDPSPEDRRPGSEWLEALESGRRASWAQVATFAGYFDQSHLIRDFTEFSGLAPSSYVSRGAGMRNHVPL